MRKSSVVSWRIFLGVLYLKFLSHSNMISSTNSQGYKNSFSLEIETKIETSLSKTAISKRTLTNQRIWISTKWIFSWLLSTENQMLDILTKTYLHLIVIMYGFSNFLEASRDFESSYKVEGKERSFSIKIKRILFDRERHIEGERDKVFFWRFMKYSFLLFFKLT